MTYSEFIDKITPYAEKEFAAFQKRLIFTNRAILGIRTPVLRKLAKEYAEDIEEIFGYPNEYYEVVFIKLTIVSLLPYEKFLQYLPQCVSLIDNWALCDCFKGKYIAKHKEEFLPVLEKLFIEGKEFYVRYVLVVLLAHYLTPKYIPIVKEYIRRTNAGPYYIHMSAAWLVAEMLIKAYDDGVSLLKEGILPPKTHDKAIQKAIESYRLTTEQKEFLRSLKIKNQRY